MVRMQRTLAVTLLMALSAALLTACNGLQFVWDRTGGEQVDLGVQPVDVAGADSAARKHTIGAVTYYQGVRPTRVRGYGLVVGLGGQGSRDCPKHIYDGLVHKMYKQHSFSAAEVGIKPTSPEQLINSMDSAVVTVVGMIPRGAVAGARFDIVVEALPGTQTTSLHGGHLFPMDLEVYRDIPERGSITGRILARASGPIFSNPFSSATSATQTNARAGIILGGGIATQDREVRLVLVQPSYQLARRIENRINARFPGARKVADALSPSFIKTSIPPEAREDPGHFLALIRALYLSRDPRFETRVARKLAKELTHPKSDHAAIALCFEGLGQAGLGQLQKLCTHPKDYVSFHAAVAAVRLGDHLASDVLAGHAKNVYSPFRFQAIRALSYARDVGAAGLALRDLLEDADSRVQIAAYEGLLQRGDSWIDSHRIGKRNFVLDQIPTLGENFIYCKRSGSRRIAFFGDGLRCRPPVFYSAADDSILINAPAGAETLSVIRRTSGAGLVSPAIPVSLDLAKMVILFGSTAGVDRNGTVTGLGLDYGSVVAVLQQLCEDRSVNAKFILEQPNVAELFGPPRPVGRPESER